MTAPVGRLGFGGMSYDDVKVAPAWKFVFVIAILLTFSGSFKVRGYVDGWILSHFEAHSFRQFLLMGWKTAVVMTWVGVGAVHMYWNSPPARQKAFPEKLETSLLLVLILLPAWLFMTFFIIWTT